MGHTLLVVDDEENILRALARLFHRTGHEVVTAASGPEGLEVVRAKHVSLIISDQRMPGMTGAQFLAEARRLQPEAVRIMLTGYSEIQSAMAAINQGQVSRFLAKPWDDDALLGTVTQALADLDLRREHAELQERVRCQNEQLRTLNEGLERTVGERTVELRTALRRSEDLNESLRQQNTATVKAFAGLLDLRSPGIGAHCRRVAGLVSPVCAALGIRDRQQVQDVVIAALLHDIGKIAFPDAILIKDPSHLGHLERVELRKHPVLGQSQVQVVESLGEVGRTIRHHHENWNGSGYPDGLAGSEIPIGAQILRALDAYDNLTKGRPPKHSEEGLVFAALDRQVSQNFDGAILHALLLSLDAKRDSYDPSREIKVPLDRIAEGMVLSRDLRTESGVLLVGKDETLRKNYIDKIRNLRAIYPIEQTVYICR